MAAQAQAAKSGAGAKSPSVVGWLAATALLTALAGGGGGFLGLELVARIRSDLEATARAAGDERPVKTRYAPDTSLRDLPPVVANLAAPANVLVRLHAAILLDGKVAHPEVVAAEIAEDIVGFMRTVSLRELEGASGLAHLREDLNERATVRSEGRVRELLIQGIVVQ